MDREEARKAGEALGQAIERARRNIEERNRERAGVAPRGGTEKAQALARRTHHMSVRMWWLDE